MKTEIKNIPIGRAAAMMLRHQTEQAARRLSKYRPALAGQPYEGTSKAALLSWSAPEYAHYEKPLIWFVVAGLICLGLVVYGVMSNDWTFSVAILVFAGTYYLIHHKKPRVVEMSIRSDAVRIGKHAIPFAKIRGFWIVHNPPHTSKLYLRMNSRLRPDVFLLLNGTGPAEVRKALTKNVHEFENKNEPFTDTLVRVIGL